MEELYTPSVVDRDPAFTIDRLTRVITNGSGKTKIVQYDHNSEQFKFIMPKMIEGHDMSKCNSVEINWKVVGSKARDTISDSFPLEPTTVNGETKLLHECSAETVEEYKSKCNGDTELLEFSWLISDFITQIAGTLSFSVRFAYKDENGEIPYRWVTETNNTITIAPAIDGGTDIVERYPDSIEAIKKDVSNTVTETVAVLRTTIESELAEKELTAGFATEEEIKAVLDYTGNDYEPGDHYLYTAISDSITDLPNNPVTSKAVKDYVDERFDDKMANNIQNGDMPGSITTTTDKDDEGKNIDKGSYSENFGRYLVNYGGYSLNTGYDNENYGRDNAISGWGNMVGVKPDFTKLTDDGKKQYEHTGWTQSMSIYGLNSDGLPGYTGNEDRAVFNPDTASKNIVGGIHNTVEGKQSIVVGNDNKLNTSNSNIIVGSNNEVTGTSNNVVLGRGLQVHGYHGIQAAVGKFNDKNAQAIFMVGTGENDENRSNGLEVYYDGQVRGGRSTTDEDDDLTLVTKDYVDNLVVEVSADSELSTESENPVQNKVVTEALATKADKEYVEEALANVVVDKSTCVTIFDLAVENPPEHSPGTSSTASIAYKIPKPSKISADITYQVEGEFDYETGIQEYITKTIELSEADCVWNNPSDYSKDLASIYQGIVNVNYQYNEETNTVVITLSGVVDTDNITYGQPRWTNVQITIDDKTAGRVYVDEQLSRKTDTTYVDEQLDTKADQSYVDEQLNAKANQSYVNEQLATKANQSYVDEQLNTKANKTYVDEQLVTKANQVTVEQELFSLKESLETTQDNVYEELATKANQSYVDDQLNTKANQSYVDQQLETTVNQLHIYVDEQSDAKANQSYVNEQLATKANQSYVDEQLDTKANQSYVNEQLAIKANQSDVTTTIEAINNELSTKLDKVTINNGNYQVYTKKPTGENIMTTVTGKPTAGTIIMRDANGNFKINNPVDSDHPTTKEYVETNLSKLNQDITNEIRGYVLGKAMLASRSLPPSEVEPYMKTFEFYNVTHFPYCITGKCEFLNKDSNTIERKAVRLYPITIEDPQKISLHSGNKYKLVAVDGNKDGVSYYPVTASLEITSDTSFSIILESIPDNENDEFGWSESMSYCYIENIDDIHTAIDAKANQSYVDEELATKANQSDVDEQLNAKANQSYVNEQLATKANQSDVTEHLNTKVNTSDFNEALDTKLTKQTKDDTKLRGYDGYAYTIDENNVDRMLGIASTSKGNTLALRNTGGTLTVATPVYASDAANKGYVDDQIKNLEVSGVIVDAELSLISERPVQNKVITSRLDEISNSMDNACDELRQKQAIMLKEQNISLEMGPADANGYIKTAQYAGRLPKPIRLHGAIQYVVSEALEDGGTTRYVSLSESLTWSNPDSFDSETYTFGGGTWFLNYTYDESTNITTLTFANHIYAELDLFGWSDITCDIDGLVTKMYLAEQINDKVDKISFKDFLPANEQDGKVRGIVYGCGTDNTQTAYRLAIQAISANTIPIRDASHNFYVGSPKQPYHCTNKQYVDNAIAAIDTSDNEWIDLGVFDFDINNSFGYQHGEDVTDPLLVRISGYIMLSSDGALTSYAMNLPDTVITLYKDRAKQSIGMYTATYTAVDGSSSSRALFVMANVNLDIDNKYIGVEFTGYDANNNFEQIDVWSSRLNVSVYARK